MIKSSLKEWNDYIVYINEEIVKLIVEEDGNDAEVAFEKWVNSATYRKFHDFRTGLYNESPVYIWEMLKEESSI